ncbi:12328_t:CDS:2 [Acaulospora morrowiae]|uniref:12328_t:CDS:1 n=1 Tax=Acaulospora morrowiae TaxID=94023 RepID=A0A9N9C9N6_9GLOM|nr:12328_t:CDS:2 [Acaulospora morrowiae]
MKINEKSTSVVVIANETRERTLGKVKEVSIMVQGVTIPVTLRVIEFRNETYRGEELEVPISHNDIEGLARPDELEVSDDKNEDTFDELEYESEDVEEEEGYYTGERSEKEETIDKRIPSPAVYLTILEEISTLEDDEEYEDEKPRMDLIGLTEKEREDAEKWESSTTGGEAGSRDEEFDLSGPLNEDLTYQNDVEGATNLDSLNHHRRI